jgi:hypothetical protein
MSFLKAFGLGFLALMVSNFLLAIILYASFGQFSTIPDFFTNPFSLTYNLFCSMGHAIWILIDRMAYHITNDNLFFALLSLPTIIAPLIAAIVAGRFGKKRIISFGAVVLIAIISLVVSLILMFNSPSYEIIIGGVLLGSGALFNLFLGGLLNMIIYGAIAFFTTKK